MPAHDVTGVVSFASGTCERGLTGAAINGVAGVLIGILKACRICITNVSSLVSGDVIYVPVEVLTFARCPSQCVQPGAENKQ